MKDTINQSESNNISISRWRDNFGNSAITVEIRDSKHGLIYSGNMTLDDFAKCVTGLSECPIEKNRT